MKIEVFIEDFADLFHDTDKALFTAQTRFREEIEEWDSLKALDVIAMVDAEYGIEIKRDDLRRNNTIEDLYNIVRLKSGRF